MPRKRVDSQETEGVFRFPAIKGEQGGRDMYIAMPTLRGFANRFQFNFIRKQDVKTDPVEATRAKTWKQRVYDENHARGIADYIVANRKDYLLGAVTLTLTKRPKFVPFESESRFGHVVLDEDAETYDTDGQHRHGAVKDAVNQLGALGADNIAILLYVEPSSAKRGQMFSDQNFNQRPVPKSVNVKFETRNPVARAANRLIEDHALLGDLVEREYARAGTGKLFAAGAVYEAIQRLIVGPNGRITNFRSVSEDDAQAVGTAFFDLLLKSRPELKRIAAEKDKVLRAGLVDDLRRNSLLASSTTLRMVAGTVYRARREQGIGWPSLQRAMAKVDFKPGAVIWTKSGFVSPGRTTPNARNQEVRQASDALLKKISGTSSPTAL
jgi:DNA sulfur modification protein DndB